MKKIIPLLCTVMIFSGMSFTANATGEGFSYTDSTATQATDSTTTQAVEYNTPTDVGQSQEITTESIYSENEAVIQENEAVTQDYEAATQENEAETQENEAETQEESKSSIWGDKNSERKKKDKDEDEPSTMDVVLKIFLFVLGGVAGASIMYAVSAVKINNIESSLKSGDKNNLKDAEEQIKSIKSILNDCNDILEKNIVPYADSTKDKFIDVSQKIGNIKYITDDTDDVYDDIQ